MAGVRRVRRTSLPDTVVQLKVFSFFSPPSSPPPLALAGAFFAFLGGGASSSSSSSSSSASSCCAITSSISSLMSVFSGLSSPGSLPSAVSSFSRTYGEARRRSEQIAHCRARRHSPPHRFGGKVVDANLPDDLLHVLLHLGLVRTGQAAVREG